jgi:hypothetical protein
MQERRHVLGVAVAVFFVATLAWAGVRTYQVTGPLVDVTDSKIVVMKGQERWEVARDAGTQVSGELKPGAKVTIVFRMTATAVTVKEAEAPKPPEKAPEKAAETNQPAAPAAPQK